MLNITEEYDKAIDCFRAALASRPNDYLLWNKLGATTANSQKPAEAIDAYFKALELNPAYIRARYNLAVSCINLGQYHEAAEHLLQALALQGGDDGSPNKAMMSEEIWDTLRLSVEWLNRPDLVDRCMERNLEGFRGEFAF
ncbi:hypothetical protein K7432_007550 [Basidiobolus ranarum]|uniref:Peroxin-5 n=1 Tax=Basidiobolus ranarum TaxID=34480 RepID=A0ABR2VZY2_9FUNG